MKKITLLFTALLAATFSFAQINITFEEGAAVLNEQAAGPTTDVTEYNYFADQDAAELHLTTVEAIPSGTTGNSSTRAIKIAFGANSLNFHYPLISIPVLDAANGNFITLKILPASTGPTTFRLGLKAGTAANVNYDMAYNPANTTDWITIGFDITGFAAGTNRLDLGFEFGTRGSDSGEITWIDDIKQVVTLSTDDNIILGKRLEVYPNPTSGEIKISNARDYKSITIHSILGKTIKTFEAAESIDISDLSTGIYLLKTDTGLIKKVIKK